VRVDKAVDGTRMRNGSYYFSLPGFVRNSTDIFSYTNSECKKITYCASVTTFKDLAYNF
jgi:hypothetical protein